MKFQLLVVGKDYTVALKKMILTPLISGSLFLVEGDVCCFQKSFIFMEDSNRRRFLNHWTVMSYWLLCQVTHSFLRQIVWDIFCRVCDWTAFIWKGKKNIYIPQVFFESTVVVLVYCSKQNRLSPSHWVFVVQLCITVPLPVFLPVQQMFHSKPVGSEVIFFFS